MHRESASHSCSIGLNPGLLNYRGLFWLLNTLDSLAREGHIGYWTKLTDLDENSSENLLSETCHFRNDLGVDLQHEGFK